jgi:hypothetical protein
VPEDAVERTSSITQVSQLEAGVMIYLSTPVYTNENEVITNLGTNIKVYAGDIVVVYS